LDSPVTDIDLGDRIVMTAVRRFDAGLPPVEPISPS
jgi:hypothetical protein